MVAHSNEVSILVAKLRRGLDVGQVVELLEPKQQRLCAPENNHLSDSVLDGGIVPEFVAQIIPAELDEIGGDPDAAWDTFSGQGGHRQWA